MSQANHHHRHHHHHHSDNENDRFYKPKKRFETKNSDDELDNAFRNMTVHDDRDRTENENTRGSSRGNNRGQTRGNRRGGRGGSGRGRVQESYMRPDKPRQNTARSEAWKNGLKNLETNEDRDRENDRLNRSNGDSHKTKENKNIRTVKGPNTIQFKPQYNPPDIRIVPAPHHWSNYQRPFTDHDVVVVNDLFCLPDDVSIYNQLLDEIESCGVDTEKIWQLWHNDSHLIADDKTHWKKNCPTFNMVLEKMLNYFGMDCQATRFNWYRNSSEWKPFHHDAAAVKPDKARTQNLTVAVSFGMEREVAFEHAKTKSTIAIPQPNGSMYAFGRDVNIRWRHGIPAIHPKKFTNKGRISIIAWGWVDDMIEEK